MGQRWLTTRSRSETREVQGAWALGTISPPSDNHGPAGVAGGDASAARGALPAPAPSPHSLSPSHC